MIMSPHRCSGQNDGTYTLSIVEVCQLLTWEDECAGGSMPVRTGPLLQQQARWSTCAPNPRAGQEVRLPHLQQQATPVPTYAARDLCIKWQIVRSSRQAEGWQG
jgi:hypothetical protein